VSGKVRVTGSGAFRELAAQVQQERRERRQRQREANAAKEPRKAGKRKKTKPRPACIICKEKRHKVGRDSICMVCYKSGKALAWRRKQAAAASALKKQTEADGYFGISQGPPIGSTVRATSASSEVSDPQRVGDGRYLAPCVTKDSRNGHDAPTAETGVL
jgi:hypothetical protein